MRDPKACPLINKNKWRYLEDDYCTASLGLATDEYLTRNLTASPYSHTLRLYTYGERCALVGKYQEVSSEINVGHCKAQGITINRRPTGGGAIIMGRGQLGVAIALPLSEDFSLLKLSIVLERYSRGILLGLGRLGIRAGFKPRNDVLVRNKKIAGLAFATIGEAGLFHASLLVDLDEEFMEGALRIPPSKKTSLTTATRELGREVSTEEIRQAVKEGYQEAFGFEPVSETLSHEEMRAIRSLEESRYRNPVWVLGQEGGHAEPCLH
jgi:lipoate-protein ligase A